MGYVAHSLIQDEEGGNRGVGMFPGPAGEGRESQRQRERACWQQRGAPQLCLRHIPRSECKTKQQRVFFHIYLKFDTNTHMHTHKRLLKGNCNKNSILLIYLNLLSPCK